MSVTSERRATRCGLCNETGHNSRTCPGRAKEETTSTGSTQTDETMLGVQFGSSVPLSDPFRETLVRNLAVLMTRLRPAQKTMLWTSLQSLYCDSPSRFTIISSIHQNDPTDRLHYSVAVNHVWGSQTFHVYGWWKTQFQITDVSISDGTDMSSVSFVKTE